MMELSKLENKKSSW